MLKSTNPEVLLAEARKVLTAQAGKASPLAKTFEALAKSFLQDADEKESSLEIAKSDDAAIKRPPVQLCLGSLKPLLPSQCMWYRRCLLNNV
jgi:hypothetical protein